MTDSTNPRVMADNIRELSALSGSQASDISTLQNTVEALGSYSTTEADTGKKWIDGSTIYRKVFTIPNMPNNSTIPIIHNITNLGTVTFIYGIMNPSENINGRFIPTGNSPGLSFKGNYIYIGASSDLSEASAIVVIEYTKSAPSALTSPAPDNTRSIESEEIPEVREEVPEIEEESITEDKKTN